MTNLFSFGGKEGILSAGIKFQFKLTSDENRTPWVYDKGGFTFDLLVSGYVIGIYMELDLKKENAFLRNIKVER